MARHLFDAKPLTRQLWLNWCFLNIQMFSFNKLHLLYGLQDCDHIVSGEISLSHRWQHSSEMNVPIKTLGLDNDIFEIWFIVSHLAESKSIKVIKIRQSRNVGFSNMLIENTSRHLQKISNTRHVQYQNELSIALSKCCSCWCHFNRDSHIHSYRCCYCYHYDQYFIQRYHD